MGRRKKADRPPTRRFLIEERPAEGYYCHWIGDFHDRDAAVEFAKSRVNTASFAVSDITDVECDLWSRGEWVKVSA